MSGGTLGRGADFSLRFNASRWAEDLVWRTLNAQPGLICLRYGLSRVVAGRRVDAGDRAIKEPDLLLLRRAELAGTDAEWLARHGNALDGMDRAAIPAFVTGKAISAIEVEFSPYRARQMKDRHWQPRLLRPNARAPKKVQPPVAPNIFVKEEDLDRLDAWRNRTGVRNLLVLHAFDEEAFVIGLDRLLRFREEFAAVAADARLVCDLQRGSGIFYALQGYDRSDAQAAGETKWVYRVHPAAAVKAGDVTGVTVGSRVEMSSSMKYVSQVVFEGGALDLTPEARAMLGFTPTPAA